jgi:hypothetical protein
MVQYAGIWLQFETSWFGHVGLAFSSNRPLLNVQSTAVN